MDKKDDGGPAYPGKGTDFGGPAIHAGMSLRDYFAGQAMAGGGGHALAEAPGDDPTVIPKLAGLAFQIADAMIAIHNKGETHD